MLDPDAAVVALDDPLADRQADAAARVLVAAVQALEDAEDALGVARVDPDAVVGHPEQPGVALALGGHLDARRVFGPELDPVADQVLEQLAQLALVAPHGRQLARRSRSRRTRATVVCMPTSVSRTSSATSTGPNRYSDVPARE